MRLLAVTLLLASTPLSAVNAQDCSDLAATLTRESVRNSSSSQRSIILKSQFCSFDYDTASDTQKRAIEGSYKILSFGASSDSESIKKKQHDECDNKYGSFWSSQISDLEVQSVSAAGLDVVKSCLNSKSFRTTAISAKENALSVEFSNGTPNPVILNGLSLIPKSIANCTAYLDGKTLSVDQVVSARVPPAASFSVSCERIPSDSATDSERKLYNGGLLTISSNDGAEIVPLSSYAIPAKSKAEIELEDRLLEVENHLTASNNQVATLKSEADLLRSSRPIAEFTVFQGQNLPFLVPSAKVHFMNSDRPGSCKGNWGDYTPEYFSALCSGHRYTVQNLSQSGGGACGNTVMNLQCFEK